MHSSSGDYDDDKESEGGPDDPAEDEDEDGDDDGTEDNYSYNYEDASGAAAAGEAAVHLVPEIISLPLVLNVTSGQTVEMPCQAKVSEMKCICQVAVQHLLIKPPGKAVT